MKLRPLLPAAFSPSLAVICTILLGRAMAQVPSPAPSPTDPDAALVRSLLTQNLSDRTFSFATVAEACSGKRVLPLTQDPAHLRIRAAIDKALQAAFTELNPPDSPLHKLRRINEASKFFEDAIRKHLQATPGIRCDTPPNRAGQHQRPGYPDLRIVDEPSQLVFYLDPKLVEQGSAASTFRSFYFEPEVFGMVAAAFESLA